MEEKNKYQKEKYQMPFMLMQHHSFYTNLPPLFICFPYSLSGLFPNMYYHNEPFCKNPKIKGITPKPVR